MFLFSYINYVLLDIPDDCVCGGWNTTDLEAVSVVPDFVPAMEPELAGLPVDLSPAAVAVEQADAAGGVQLEYDDVDPRFYDPLDMSPPLAGMASGGGDGMELQPLQDDSFPIMLTTAQVDEGAEDVKLAEQPPLLEVQMNEEEAALGDEVDIVTVPSAQDKFKAMLCRGGVTAACG